MKCFLLLSLVYSLVLFSQCNDNDNDQNITDKLDDGKVKEDWDSDKTNTEFTNMNADTILHDGLIREYLLYVPDVYDGSFEVPLMLNFHGNGSSASSHMEYADMRNLADSNNFILVYPQGTILDGSSHWNNALESSTNKSSTKDFEFTNALINKLTINYNIDSSRIYACGFSNGADFTFALACYNSNKIAAIGAVSGLMYEETIDNCNPLHPTAVIEFHGTSDSYRPYEGITDYYASVEDMLNHWTSFNHTSIDPLINSITDNGTLIEYYAYNDGDSGTSVEHYKVVEGDHVWFDLSYEEANTSEIIWNFVSKYDINGLR
jgi:polyhydroxybutyrate depolymerase